MSFYDWNNDVDRCRRELSEFDMTVVDLYKASIDGYKKISNAVNGKKCSEPATLWRYQFLTTYITSVLNKNYIGLLFNTVLSSFSGSEGHDFILACPI